MVSGRGERAEPKARRWRAGVKRVRRLDRVSGVLACWRPVRNFGGVREQAVAHARDGFVLESRSPLKFIVLVFLLSVPFWLVGAVTGGKLSADLPVSAVMVVCPVTAGAMLRYRESGTGAVREVLGRSFDFHRISAKAWCVPAILVGPAVYISTYLLMRLTGVPVPNPQLPLVESLAALAGFFLAGLGEELGWSGYAMDPLQIRWGALRAGILLGVVWAVWHGVPLWQVGRSAGWIGWWAIGTVAFRVLLTWLYNNTGKSVFAVAVAHGLTNLAWIGPFLYFGPGGYPYEGERISALFLAAAAASVTVVWGPRTLTGRGNADAVAAASA